jgi:hypothetical protein
MDIKEQVALEKQQDMDHYKRDAQALVRDALAHGVVVTISIKSRRPLAMGNYDLAVDVRERRVLADPIVREVAL